ncbi:GNAT family N-acetyltransferase [Saccharibacillus sp. CPCC 101409]|uniref:GNAT family N-acetyltransferase n=1 Tax=Saccharibacillus sp. CPCC 101409 TaxID=3058041 RepID=UPI002672AFAF|nr:GNAT family N-acetyltransferase [Saccharibacillus sp. CPCC 101409]MDO3411163.1 GNAT family N-acetyltransferase [Saccharibacillus sp. CPCC 101409]
MTIQYVDSLESIKEDSFAEGFFAGWPNPPSPETFVRVLHGSAHVVLALDDESGQIIGFINALSDGVLSAYIPLLEVIPAYQSQGIGRELARRMLKKLDGHYMVDLLCDPELESFYARQGMRKANGMMLRNYKKQSGML